MEINNWFNSKLPMHKLYWFWRSLCCAGCWQVAVWKHPMLAAEGATVVMSRSKDKERKKNPRWSTSWNVANHLSSNLKGVKSLLVRKAACGNWSWGSRLMSTAFIHCSSLNGSAAVLSQCCWSRQQQALGWVVGFDLKGSFPTSAHLWC